MSVLALDDRLNPIYAGLQEVREIFHADGKLSDSNQKLDETLKLLAIHFCGHNGTLDNEHYQTCLDEKTFTVQKLQLLFEAVINSDSFRTAEGSSLFEHSPKLAFSDDDSVVVYKLFKTLEFFGENQTGDEPIDFVNEAFGHFVRDNFRSNTEDAQYMTPQEVVEFMVEIALSLVPNSEDKELVVMDPSCGVGSFLASFCRRYNLPAKYVAQDKVERMARLTAANFEFSETSDFEIHVGNSLYDGAAIDVWNSKVDLILTNPPFGAKFDQDDIRTKCKANLPVYANANGLPRSVDSELAFIERYIGLLRPGGVCLVVVPDGVISAKGAAAFARTSLLRQAKVLGVVELPAVTFAQAGTRTKTSILIFRKNGPDNFDQKIFVGEAKSVGFEVSKRKGVPVKRHTGNNDLLTLLKDWRNVGDEPFSDLGRWIEANLQKKDAWTPRALMFEKATLEKGAAMGLVPMNEIASLAGKRKSTHYKKGAYFISVLHVIGEGLLDVTSLLQYEPITPGKPVNVGEVLVSRINPRIPRVLVVPDLPGQIICSSEFEVLVPHESVSPYHLAYSLLTPLAQQQLQSLTAGTSASHSRIKPGKIIDIQVPWPSDKAMKLEMAAHEKDLRSVFRHMWSMSERRKSLDT